MKLLLEIGNHCQFVKYQFKAMSLKIFNFHYQGDNKYFQSNRGIFIPSDHNIM